MSSPSPKTHHAPDVCTLPQQWLGHVSLPKMRFHSPCDSAACTRSCSAPAYLHMCINRHLPPSHAANAPSNSLPILLHMFMTSRRCRQTKHKEVSTVSHTPRHVRGYCPDSANKEVQPCPSSHHTSQHRVLLSCPLCRRISAMRGGHTVRSLAANTVSYARPTCSRREWLTRTFFALQMRHARFLTVPSA